MMTRRRASFVAAGATSCVAFLLISLPTTSDAFSLGRAHTSSCPTSTVLHSTPPVRPAGTSRSAFEGRPSFPGWRKEQLGKLTDWAVSDEANRAVICEYEPDALWLWTKWRGTVLSLVVAPVMFAMIMSGVLDYGVHYFSTSPPWPILSVPPVDDPLVQQLEGLNTLWEYQLTLCTFILTFFTAEAYKHWRNVYFTTRAIQGRINDICLLVTVGAERGYCTEMGCKIEREGITTGYSARGLELVQHCTRLVRLSHTFFWAATPTCSNGVGDGGVSDEEGFDLPPEQRQENAIGPLLLSNEGLGKLVAAGELTKEECAALIRSGLSPSQYCYVLLEWLGLNVMEAIQNGVLRGGCGLEQNILRQITDLRAQYFTIGDHVSGRMPLAYVQLVQVLVDSLCLLSPLAIYPELGSLALPATGLLTLFYKGLLELSKSFLDPFGNEGYPGQNIRIDVLVSELNFGANSRWVKAGESLPLEQ